ncbi:hypothetical protein Tco_0452988 [Tanacetum coccineum]
MTNASSLLSSSVLCLNKATQVFNEHFQMQKIVTINTIASTTDPPPITVMIKKSMLLLTVRNHSHHAFEENLSTVMAPRKSLNAHVTGTIKWENVKFRVPTAVCCYYVRNTWGKYGFVHLGSAQYYDYYFSFPNLVSSDGLMQCLKKTHGFIRSTLPYSENVASDVIHEEDVGIVPVPSYDMCMQSWGRSSYARAMIELRANVELKDNIMAAMPKIAGEGYYARNICVEYVWKFPRCACCKVFGHVLEECLKNIDFGVTKKKTSQTPKGIPV